jgi:hypothetical protein
LWDPVLPLAIARFGKKKTDQGKNQECSEPSSHG